MSSLDERNPLEKEIDAELKRSQKIRRQLKKLAGR